MCSCVMPLHNGSFPPIFRSEVEIKNRLDDPSSPHQRSIGAKDQVSTIFPLGCRGGGASSSNLGISVYVIQCLSVRRPEGLAKQVGLNLFATCGSVSSQFKFNTDRSNILSQTQHKK